ASFWNVFQRQRFFAYTTIAAGIAIAATVSPLAKFGSCLSPTEYTRDRRDLFARNLWNRTVTQFYFTS
ncbi:hypothetical protein LTR60_007937, partial [Cryomyces antarcticus]